jgi:hypothetical protein
VPFADWENFYVIVGSSAAALTGLQFVVIALVSDLRRRTTGSEIGAFGTPTILHFGAVLLQSAILSAPWHRVTIAAALIGAGGLSGVIYSLLVIRRARRQTGYRPVLEDWIFHVVLPLAAYAVLFASAWALPSAQHEALFAMAGSAVLLLVIGIHNAWDTVTFLVVSDAQQRSEAQKSQADATAPR